jgi:hypothetical protein
VLSIVRDASSLSSTGPGEDAIASNRKVSADIHFEQCAKRGPTERMAVRDVLNRTKHQKSNMNAPWPWHRLFGLSLIDFFRGLPVTVELEKDLSERQQFLDVVVVRMGLAPLSIPLPDGFEDLGPHNLITFKSFRQPLDVWSLEELIGHYVNYRKLVSPSLQVLLPETEFRLFAVCTRFPQGLANQVALKPVKAGVYDVPRMVEAIRMIVVNELPRAEHNAILHLFSSRLDLLRYGVTHYRQRSSETSSLLQRLLVRHQGEGLVMLDLMEELRKEKDQISQEFWDVFLSKLPPEELLKGVPAEERLKGLPAEERLKGLPAEERLKGLSLEEILRAIPPESRSALKDKL